MVQVAERGRHLSAWCATSARARRPPSSATCRPRCWRARRRRCRARPAARGARCTATTPTSTSTPGPSPATSSEIAKAGRAVYDLPMYVNNALRDPLEPIGAVEGQLRQRRSDLRRDRHLQGRCAEHRHRRAGHLPPRVGQGQRATCSSSSAPDNALFVPELGNAEAYARYVYQILGRGSIGVAPFGIDYFDYANFPLGAKHSDKRDGRAIRQGLRRLRAHAAPVGALGLRGPHPRRRRGRRPRRPDGRDEGLEGAASASASGSSASGVARQHEGGPAARGEAARAASRSRRSPTTSSCSSASSRACAWTTPRPAAAR